MTLTVRIHNSVNVTEILIRKACIQLSLVALLVAGFLSAETKAEVVSFSSGRIVQ